MTIAEFVRTWGFWLPVIGGVVVLVWLWHEEKKARNKNQPSDPGDRY